MLGKWIKRIVALLVVALIAGAAVYALMPQPLAVDVAVVGRGPLEVTIDEEGVARIRDVFRVYAPVGGRLQRSVLHVGDRVSRGATTVAVINPAEPGFLDARARSETEAAIASARAAIDLAEAQLVAAQANEGMARATLEREQALAKRGTISAAVFDKSVNDLANASAQRKQAEANLVLQKSQLASAQAKLIGPDGPVIRASEVSCCMTVSAPADGVVLKLLTESEQVVAAGTPLLEIGDPKELEIVVHLLSADAAGIAPGTEARLDQWGGATLAAVVDRVDPAAYTKVSALGIEEQRVDATLRLTDPYETWRGLGHEFRVMAHIVTWRSADILSVPLGALFRRGSEWSVFRVVEGKAVAIPVEIGHRNTLSAEIVKGLSAGDKVILHPSDKVGDGVAVTSRDAAEG